MDSYFADLHIHIGRTDSGTAVKISASNKLTFSHIAEEASKRKGIDLVGIIDCHAPDVLADIDGCLQRGEMLELDGGGIRYQQTTIIPGCEIEVKKPGYSPAHVLTFFPNVEEMKRFSHWLSSRVTNIHLSTQRLYEEPQRLQEMVKSCGGLVIPAHIFTPYKSVFSSGATKLAELFDPLQVDAVELGLSADSEMAGGISELQRFAFTSNSDAHSLTKIAREYNQLCLKEPAFCELKSALQGVGGREITANYGLNPHLGKYNRSYCAACRHHVADEAAQCPVCGNTRIVEGVAARIQRLSERNQDDGNISRPPYIYQTPLEFIQGLGPSKLKQLLKRFGSEMNILHRADEAELIQAAGEPITRQIIASRKGTLAIKAGGGGIYGKIVAE